ncbi:MAG TPA: peptidase M20, partial [Anaerolineae bacterium]|nr:peptidase M20 [Anaerolineae bacterium]
MTSWQAYLDQHQEQYLNELMDFLRIPSISALPDHAPDVRRAAEWAAKRMQAAGLEKVEVMPTCGHPVVYGEWLHAPGQPTILIYGHVDTQPVDPLAEWTSPPFEPVVRDGRI